MLLIIFGAGASFDAIEPAVSDVPSSFRPPLARELFANRPDFNYYVNTTPYVKNIVQALRFAVAANRDVEEELERLAARPPAETRIKELVALRYYVHAVMAECGKWAPDDMTNYRHLAYVLESWQAEHPAADRHVMIVTFNYDTLLERGFTAVYGRFYQSHGDYTSDPRVHIIKLHGSVGWGRATEKVFGFPQTVSLEAFLSDIRGELELQPSIRADFAGGLQLVDQENYLGGAVTGRVVVPAIAIPVRTKIQYECPSSQIDLMKRRLKDATRVLIVGWRGGEEGFLRSLAAELPKGVPILAVTSERGLEALRSNLARAGVCAPDEVRPSVGGLASSCVRMGWTHSSVREAGREAAWRTVDAWDRERG